jgi:hypothetical protein
MVLADFPTLTRARFVGSVELSVAQPRFGPCDQGARAQQRRQTTQARDGQGTVSTILRSRYHFVLDRQHNYWTVNITIPNPQPP